MIQVVVQIIRLRGSAKIRPARPRSASARSQDALRVMEIEDLPPAPASRIDGPESPTPVCRRPATVGRDKDVLSTSPNGPSDNRKDVRRPEATADLDAWSCGSGSSGTD